MWNFRGWLSSPYSDRHKWYLFSEAWKIKLLKSPFFWNVALCQLVISGQNFETTILSQNIGHWSPNDRRMETSTTPLQKYKNYSSSPATEADQKWVLRTSRSYKPWRETAARNWSQNMVGHKKVQGITEQAEVFTYDQLQYLIMGNISNWWNHHT